LKKTRIKSKKTVPPLEQASSSNEQPKRTDENSALVNDTSKAQSKGRIALLTTFDGETYKVLRQSEDVSAAASSSKDDASISSFSIVNEQ
jgi:lipocalin